MAAKIKFVLNKNDYEILKDYNAHGWDVATLSN